MVTNPSGSGVPEATVTISNAATSLTQTATTGANGSYTFSLLAPGDYRVQFASPGFRTAEMPDVVVNVAEVPNLDATLEPDDAGDPFMEKREDESEGERAVARYPHTLITDLAESGAGDEPSGTLPDTSQSRS